LHQTGPDTANITAEAMKEDGTVNRGGAADDLQSRRPARPGNRPEVRDEHGGTVTV